MTGRVTPHRRLRRRVAGAAAVLLLVTAVIIGRLVNLQIIDPDRYVAEGESQRIRTLDLPAARGSIVDRNGVELALSVNLPSIVADPRLVEDPHAASRALAPVLDVDELFLEERLSRDKAFVYLERQVDEATAAEVMALGIPGVFTQDEPTRFRPGGALAYSVLGRTDIDNQGISGVELAFDDALVGTAGSMVVELGLRGHTIPGGERQVDPAEQGQTVVLSIDRTLQYEAERLLIGEIAALGARGGVLLAMDPRTGEILVSATVAEDETTGIIQPASENRAITWAYEPGSIIKPLTMSAVIEDGLGTPATTMDVPDEIWIWDEQFTDSRPHATESWSLGTILAESSNVGVIQWAQLLGPNRLYEQLDRFGVGADTDLQLPREEPGRLPLVDEWSGTSLPTIAIGQGVTTTPLQMLLAYGALANEGVMAEPSIVLGERDEEGEFVDRTGETGERIVATDVASAVVDMMERVVAEGTGQNAQVPGYEVAGKTGTAWKALPEGGYGETDGDRLYVASFAGMLPADDPQLVVLVVIDEPQWPRYSGSQAAAPIFSDFASYAVRHLRIPSEADVARLAGDERVRATAPTVPVPTTTTAPEQPSDAEATG